MSRQTSMASATARRRSAGSRRAPEEATSSRSAASTIAASAMSIGCGAQARATVAGQEPQERAADAGSCEDRGRRPRQTEGQPGPAVAGDGDGAGGSRIGLAPGQQPAR